MQQLSCDNKSVSNAILRRNRNEELRVAKPFLWSPAKVLITNKASQDKVIIEKVH